MLFQEGTFINVDQERCLNHHHLDIGCNHCVSLCPGEALQVDDNKIDFDSSKCLGCGVCFTNCPTEVFRAKPYDETTIMIEVTDKGATTTQFFCENHPTPFLKKEDRDKGAIQIPTCLGSISKGAWYEIGLQTKVELRLETCNDCTMKDCLKRLAYSIDTAMEWLVASGHNADFTTIYSAEDTMQKKKLRATATGMKVTSRRDLFLSLFNMGKKTIDRVREEDYATKGQRKRSSTSLLPRWKKRLGNTYIENYQDGGTPAYWPVIEKKSTCVNCCLCARNCPTQTLQIQVENGKAIHLFTSGHCLDCRICQLFCPTESIIRDRQAVIHPFETKVVTEIPVGRCKQCGNHTADNNASQLCYWCENEAPESDVIADVLKFMF